MISSLSPDIMETLDGSNNTLPDDHTHDGYIDGTGRVIAKPRESAMQIRPSQSIVSLESTTPFLNENELTPLSKNRRLPDAVEATATPHSASRRLPDPERTPHSKNRTLLDIKIDSPPLKIEPSPMKIESPTSGLSVYGDVAESPEPQHPANIAASTPKSALGSPSRGSSSTKGTPRRIFHFFGSGNKEPATPSSSVSSTSASGHDDLPPSPSKSDMLLPDKEPPAMNLPPIPESSPPASPKTETPQKPKNRHTKTYSLWRGVEQNLALIDVLKDETNVPVSRNCYQSFLEGEVSLENLKFWTAVEQLKILANAESKTGYGPPSPPVSPRISLRSVERTTERNSESTLQTSAQTTQLTEKVIASLKNILGDVEPTTYAVASKISELFVDKHASEPVNVDHQMKTQMLAALDNKTNRDWSSFYDAQEEIFRLMNDDSFQRFRKIAINTNVDKFGKRVRGICCLLSLFLFLCIFVPIYFSHLNRFFRICGILFLWTAVAFSFQYRQSFCMFNQLSGAREKQQVQEKLKETFVVEYHRIIAQRMYIKTTLITLIVMAGLVAIPPYPLY